jgi:hypothetical protein
MRRALFVVVCAAVLVSVMGSPSAGRDRPFSTADLVAFKWGAGA